MKLKTRCRVLAMIISLSAILPGCAGYSAANQVNALDKTASLNVSGPQVVTTAQMGNVVMEWNEQAASRTLSASPALQPIQQTRLMAIVQLAMHDAVNGITGQYATYLTPGAAPANASPDAAEIAGRTTRSKTCRSTNRHRSRPTSRFHLPHMASLNSIPASSTAGQPRRRSWRSAQTIIRRKRNFHTPRPAPARPVFGFRSPLRLTLRPCYRDGEM